MRPSAQVLLCCLLITACTAADRSASNTEPASTPRQPATATPSATSASTTSATSSAAGTVALDCSGPIGDSPIPPEGTRSVLDAVAFVPSTTVLQASDNGDDSDPFELFAKTALHIRVGGTASITVIDSQRRHVAIAWGNHVAQWASALTIPACPRAPSTSGDWITFPGGFAVDRPACVHLLVAARGRTQQVDVSVGAACPAPGVHH